MPFGSIEKRREYNKKIWARDKVKRGLAHKEWYRKNRERMIEKEREKRKRKDPRYVAAYLKSSRLHRKEKQLRSRAWRKKVGPDGLKKQRLRIRFKISLEDYQKMEREQNFLCAICEGEDDRSLAVDHDHKTGKIRGLLCHNCNLALGNAKDSPEILMKMIKYLKIYESRTNL